MPASTHKCSNDWNFPIAKVPIIGTFLVAVGCYSPSSLDRYTGEEVRRVARAEPGISAETLSDSSQQILVPTIPPDTLLELNRSNVLAIASESSRNLQSRREDLYRAGLSLFGTRRNFGLGFSGTLDYVFSAGDDKPDTREASVALALERILPTGGRVRAAGSQTVRDEDSPDADGERYASRAQIRVDQPLLAGAGYGPSHEELIQAERDYVYAVRRFALERQDFAINVLREYYNLLGQRKVLENTRTNYQQFVFLRQRSEALFQVNRAPAIDVLRSQQEELSAFNRLTTTEEAYGIQVGRFLVSLGLPSEWQVSLADDIPELRRIVMDETNAVALALAQRIDLRTVRDQLDDSRRKLFVARNAFLPEVNLFGASDWSSGEVQRFSDQTLDNEWQAGVRAEIPLDRRSERDAVRQAEINLQAAERRLEEQTENTRLEVRESYSRLRSLLVSVEIQLKNIEIAEKRAANAILQFRSGRLSNRDVIEAANQLLDARNAYIGALADYEIQRLTLLRQIGLLDVSREGVILELTPET